MLNYKNDHAELYRYNYKHLVKQAINQIQGLAAAIIYDGKIDDSEIELLHKWIISHDELLKEFPLNDLKLLFNMIIEDNLITLEERNNLLLFLDAIALFTEGDPVVSNIFDENIDISFPDQEFVFTGELVYSPREIAVERTIALGGIVKNGITLKTKYLIVGSQGSEFWVHQKFGTKVKKAIEYKRNKGASIHILKEKEFVKALINT